MRSHLIETSRPYQYRLSEDTGMRKKIERCLSIAGSLFLGLSGFLFAAPEPAKIPIVFVETVTHSDLFDQLMYPARLVSRVNATILAETDGIVRSIASPLGKSVHKQDKLMVIANTDPVYQYAPMVVVSPVEGVVSQVEVTEGSRVSRGQKLAAVTDPKQVRLQIEVALSDQSSLRVGMSGNLSINSHRENIPVQIVGISPLVDPGTGTATAELRFEKPQNPPLPPGLVGRVTFRAREHRGIEIPEHALVYKGQAPYVRVVENGVARLKAVRLGDTRRGAVEVLDGIGVGAILVVRASGYVADGEKVTVQSADKASGG